MLYHLTIIRLNKSNNTFENTEYNKVCLEGDVFYEIYKLHLRAKSTEEEVKSIRSQFSEICKLQTRTLEIQSEKSIWFLYISAF